MEKYPFEVRKQVTAVTLKMKFRLSSLIDIPLIIQYVECILADTYTYLSTGIISWSKTEAN